MDIFSNKNQYAHLTAKERAGASFPTKWLYKKGLIQGRVLDYGCGFGADVKYLQKEGIAIYGYDKYHAHRLAEGKFDTILCHYVLNVLLMDEQAEVLMHVSELLKPGGKAFFTVRRDLKYEGFRTHKIHQKPTYQCNIKLPFKSILQTEHCEIYEFQHYNIATKTSQSSCPFCCLDSDHEILTETATVYGILDKYPVTNGHALVIPKIHTAEYFDLSAKDQVACWLVVNRVKVLISERYKPDGFNIGINVGTCAGQTVPHVHIHVIPRYKGDVEDPTGGVRGVIPDKRKY